MSRRARVWDSLRMGALFLVGLLGAVALSFSSQAPTQTAPTASAAQQPIPQATPTTAPPSSTTPTPQTIPPPPPRAGLNIVVLDPAHGGTDPGARGTGGMRESEIVLDFAAQVKKALESEGFQVLQTRQGDEDPSFDDRSAMANAQTGAVFVTLHIGSTGLPGTVRVYVYSDWASSTDTGGLIPWGRAQAPFEGLSRKLGDLVQGLLAQRFKGSPSTAETAVVRQLRTTAAPAIAVEVSSVVVEDRAALDQMAPGVADAIAIGVAEFRPSYVVPTTGGGTP
ncbi:MAG: N-acetylmuramoyl-L-alanine amidase [Candidatus Acidiferrum sp.]